jgi:S-formylglutathione hydrolase FrmB
MHLTLSWRRRIVGACAAALVLPLAVSAGTASAAPTTAVTVAPRAAINPLTVSPPVFAGQTVTFSIFSPAMDRTVPIQLLVPTGYNINDAATTYPELYQLDGLRADPNITDWSRKADTQAFFADKRVLVVQVIGGYASFFQDWETQDAGILNQSKQNVLSPAGQLKWESFLTGELPGVIGSVFHGNGTRAVSGLSMGGSSAFSLAAKHPALYKAAASYSGYLDSQAPGMPEFLHYVLAEQSGASNADDMWGPPTDPAWTANNPTAQIANLRGMSLYMSAGTGGNGPYDQPLGFFGLSASYVGAILEVIANYSSQSFAQRAMAGGIAVTTDLSNPGIHDWPYWSGEYKRSWPQLAAALGVANPGFVVQGAIAIKWNLLGGAKGVLGRPTSNEIAIAGGAVSHFTGGDIYWSPSTGAYEVQGLNLAKYNEMGGPSGFLGFPFTDEMDTPTKPGKYNHFVNGDIYFSPSTGSHEVHGLILQEWARQGWENSRFGFPVSDELAIPNGRQSNFQAGFIRFVNGQIIVS